MSYAVHVAGLSPETSEDKVKDFFLFCGAISSLKKDGNTADITFQKESAARTALMLNGGTLDGAHLEVTSASPSAPATTGSTSLPMDASASTPIGASASGSGSLGADEHGIEQEDKPKAGIMAEYLAAGYHVSDLLIQRAIEVDHKQGISSKFLAYMQKLDSKVGSTVANQPDAKVSGVIGGTLAQATTKAKEIDQQRGISSFFLDYYSKAINTNTGQKVLQFYTSTTKQVKDVHEEAVRIASEKRATVGTDQAAHDVAPTVTEKVDQATAQVPVAAPQ